MQPSRPFAYSGKKRAVLECGAVSLEGLAKRYGTPLYVYSADAIAARVKMFGAAFAGVKHTVCYSLKANSNLAVLKLLDGLGAGFDIVSGGELERVLRVSRKAAQRVVFSGVGKTAEEMDRALEAEILIFNVESVGELELLAARARKKKRVARVALRVNPDVFAETHPYISTGLREHKFGIDIREARAVYALARKEKWLDAAGVSVHIGSQIRHAEPFGAALARVSALVEELIADGVNIRHVDAGGGLGVDYGQGEFDAEAAVEEYAGQVKAGLAGFDGELLLEPGRFVIAQAGALLTRVQYVKQNEMKTFVVTDAGMNDLIRPSLYQAHHEIVPVVRDGDRESLVVDVVGPVCESGDFFARDREMPVSQPGDLLAVLDAGAYGMSLSSNYNTRPRPAEVLVEGKKTRLVRRRETIRDLLGPESV